jgi:hypothetical protein
MARLVESKPSIVRIRAECRGKFMFIPSKAGGIERQVVGEVCYLQE